MTNAPDLWRRLAAEFLGSAFPAAAVIGSGIAGMLIMRLLYPALTPAQAVTIVISARGARRRRAGRGPPGTGA